MQLQFDKQQLEELMQAFYTLTGIRFVLFDSEFREIAFYPKEKSDFCKLMSSCPKTRAKCRRSNRQAFLKCQASNTPAVYKCHAGLIEAVIPLHNTENIIGYLMFGQITDEENKQSIYKSTDYWTTACSINADDLNSAISDIAVKTDNAIYSAAKIMEACTSYIIYKELITSENSKLISSAKKCIEEQLSSDISVDSLCRELNVGRTKLYEIFRKELNMGISEYILRRRMHRAKKLLKTTKLSVAEVSAEIGFSDYNYFSKVFKKIYGKAPRSYRK